MRYDSSMITVTHAFSGFSVNDLDAAKAFYEQKLGLTVTQTEQGLQLDIEGSGDVFIYPKEDHVPATFTVLNFVVPDISAAVDDLIKAGIVFEQYSGMHTDERGIAWGAKEGMGPNIAWFTDPAKNIFSLIEE